MKTVLRHYYLLVLPAAAFAAIGLLPAGSGVNLLTAQEEKKGEEADKAEAEFREKYYQFVTHLSEAQRYDVARSLMEELQKAPVDDEVFVRVLESRPRAIRFLEDVRGEINEITARLERKGKLEAPEENLYKFCTEFPKFWDFYHARRLKVASNPDRIRVLVDKLGKSGMQATEYERDLWGQLEIAGAYAVPYMVDVLGQSNVTEAGANKAQFKSILDCLEQRIQGRAVEGLVAAVRGTKDDRLRMVLCTLLGKLAYPASAPALKEIADNGSLPQATRNEARKAFETIANSGQRDMSASQLYLELAEFYWRDRIVPRPDPGPNADVWLWEANHVVNKKVAPDAWYDALARRYAWEAIKLAPHNEYPAAWALFLAAFQRFEVKQAASAMGKAEDPLRPTEPWKDVTYTCVSAGATRIVAALAKAMEEDAPENAHQVNTIIRLLQCLSLTGGDEQLRTNAQAANVLTRGLIHPDQIIRIETAMNIVRMHPNVPAAQWQKVVPSLAEAIHMTGRESLLVVSRAQPIRDGLANAFKDNGYDVARAETVEEAEKLCNEQAGFAFVVLGSDQDDKGGAPTVERLRRHAVLAKTPFVWVVPTDALKQAETLARNIKGLHPLDEAKTKDPKQVIEYVQKNVKAPRARPVGTDADTYAVNAIELLRKLAEARNRVFDFLQAQSSLVKALDDEREPVARAAAGALGFFPTAEAQRALAAAGAKKGREPVQLSALAALAESGRKHGQLINLKQDGPTIEKLALQSLEQAASQEIRTASVAALGALNLPPKKVFDILSTTIKTD